MGIPAEQQQLISGSSILASSGKHLSEILPEGVQRGQENILCLRRSMWCVIPRYSGPNNVKQNQGQLVTLSIEEAKERCEAGGLGGFTFIGTSEVPVSGCTELSLKPSGFALGLNNTSGYTYVRVTPEGRQTVLQAIRQKKGKARIDFVQSIRDVETVLMAIERDAALFPMVHHELRDNPQIVKMAVSANGYTLEHAPACYRADAEIVRAAILANPFALQYASTDLRDDKELVLLALEGAPTALKYVGEALRTDASVCLAALERDGLALKYVSSSLRKDLDIVLAAILQNPASLIFASASLREGESEQATYGAAVPDDHVGAISVLANMF